MRIDYTDQFLKQLKKAPVPVRKAFQVRLDLFLSNQHHPLLRNHALTGEYTGRRSINITGDWRAVYRKIESVIDEPIILFLVFGTHSRLYR